MTYVAPSTVVAGQTYGASAHNVIVNDIIDHESRINDLTVPPSALLRRTTDLTSYTSGSAISWSSAEWDTDGMFDSGAPTKITIQTSGLYLVSFYVHVTGSATITQVQMDINVNGGQVHVDVVPPYNTTSAYLGRSTVVKLNATDYITGGIFFFGGSNYTIKGAGSLGISYSRLSATWIGRTS